MESLTYISDSFLGLILSVSGLLDDVIDLTLDLNQITLQLLLGVDQAGVLQFNENNVRCVLNIPASLFKYIIESSLPESAEGQHAH